MKKLLLMLMFTGAFLWTSITVNELLAQEMTELTVPDYSYGLVGATTGTVTYWGITNPGPYGEKSTRGEERPYDVFFAHGWRWWQYVVNEFRCRDFPDFNFPGLHGYGFTSYGACPEMGYPDIGDMASWGGVVVEPASRQMWSLAGAANNEYGPTEPYYIGPFGYPPSSIWGSVSAYSYLRKVVVVQSTGTLQTGDPVDIKASLTSQGVFGGDGDISDIGVLFLNKISEHPWWSWLMGRDYLNWGDVADILGNSQYMNNMLGNLIIYLNNTANTTATVAIGDTIILEVAFNNEIKLDNPEIRSNGESEGWVGERPAELFPNIVYATNDSIKNMIKKHGNTLTYDLISLTPGAVLEPVNPDGPNLDADVDGISDAREKGPDGNDETFDGNADGIPDWEQANASSFHTFDGQNYVTIVAPVGTELSQLLVTDNPSPLDAPENADFSFGFFDFSIDGLEPGESIVVTLILHTGEPVDTYYKYGLTPLDPTPHWYEFMYDGQTGAQISGPVINLHFTDGLRGDEDITVNGSIKEPGGPAIGGTTGMTELVEESVIKVYPNPANDHIILQLNNIIPVDAYILRIHSITGQTMQEKIVNVCDSNEEFVIPTGDLPGGLYMITLSGRTYVYKSRFVKLE